MWISMQIAMCNAKYKIRMLVLNLLKAAPYNGLCSQKKKNDFERDKESNDEGKNYK